MRYAFAAVILAASVAEAAAAPSPKQLMSAYAVADDGCRGSPSIDSECFRRTRITSRLNQLGFCYGQQGQGRSEFRWHRCAASSMRNNDLTPD